MKTFRVRFFVIACLCTFLVYFFVDLYHQENELELQTKEYLDEKDLLLIDQSIQDESIETDKNIYFIETYDKNFHNIDARQACSIESAGMTKKLINKKIDKENVTKVFAVVLIAV